MHRQVKCHPYIHRVHTPSSPWTLPNLCKSYSWPSSLPGNGIIAIVELGGGWTTGDMSSFFSSINQPVPSITDISVDGTTNSKQRPQSDADYEVALDIQVAGAAYYLATGKPATIRVYWAQDIAPAIDAAAKDDCTVFSCSWGNDEAEWGVSALLQIEASAASATATGMTLFAASGDNDSSDGGPNAANVDAPASCPHFVGCGGTTKTPSSETVWNNNAGETDGEGTGGGYSTVFDKQKFQKGAPHPPFKFHNRGRMVPDVTANADPNTGYEIVVYGQSTVVGGTSAVAPLYAGLFAAFGKKLGFVSPLLWHNQGDFTDIVSGGNGEFNAIPGPDPCSGIGSLIASKLVTTIFS
jgi:kumamolisin